MDQNTDLKLIEPDTRKSKTNFQEIELDSQERWKGIIYFMLDLPQENRNDMVTKALMRELLIFANFVEFKKDGRHSLTSEGFQFILQDAPMQVQ